VISAGLVSRYSYVPGRYSFQQWYPCRLTSTAVKIVGQCELTYMPLGAWVSETAAVASNLLRVGRSPSPT
jgi:hypothetical protein